MKAGWQVKRLEEICDILDNKRIPITKRDRVVGAYPYYGATGILDYVSNYIFDEKLILIGEDGAKWGSGESTAFVAEGRYWVNNHAHVIRPHRDKVLDNWLVYYFNQLDLADYVSGLTVPKLNQGSLRSIEIPLLPIPEQQRIVSILDEAFDAIAVAKANAEQNLKNARELFDSYLQSVFTQRGEGWVEKILGDMCIKIQDGAHNSPQNQSAEKTPNRFLYITSKNIRNNYVDLTNVSYVDAEFHNSIYPRCKPEIGDVLLTKDGANTGNVTLNTIDEPFSLLSSVCLIKTERDKLNPSFLKYYIQSPIGIKSIIGKMTGAAIKRIVLRDIKFAAIPVPDIEMQHFIVARLDSLSAETQRLESIYQQKIAALDELKQSLLHRAFAGEL